MSPTPRINTYSTIWLLVVLCASVGLPLAIPMLLAAASRPIGIRWPADLVIALLFGATMTALFFAYQYFGSRSVARAHGFLLAPLELPHASQTLEVTVEADLNTAMKMATGALKHLNPTRSVTVSEAKVATVTPIGWRTWGERLEIALDQPADHKTLLRLSSRRRYGSNHLDVGRGLENVARLASYLRDIDEITKAANQPRRVP